MDVCEAGPIRNFRPAGYGSNWIERMKRSLRRRSSRSLFSRFRQLLNTGDNMAYSHNVLAGIVTYNPDMDNLRANIGAVAPQVGAVLVVDNGSANVDEIERLAAEYAGTGAIFCLVCRPGYLFGRS